MSHAHKKQCLSEIISIYNKCQLFPDCHKIALVSSFVHGMFNGDFIFHMGIKFICIIDNLDAFRLKKISDYGYNTYVNLT